MVNKTHSLYDHYLPQIQLVNDVCDGDYQLKQNAKVYFPLLPKENNTEYNARISRPAFDNFTSRFLDNMTGLIFAKTPSYEVGTKLETLLEDIDMDSKTHVDMSQLLTESVFKNGRVGVMVDISNTEQYDAMSATQVEAMKIRPYAKVYSNNSIINWRYENNALQMVVLKETVQIWLDEFESADVEQYRVLTLDSDDEESNSKYYRARVIRMDKDKNEALVSDTYPTMNGKKMQFIPFYTTTPLMLDINPVKPPLYDMAVNNLSGFKLKIDLYHGLFYTIPTPYGSGINDTEAPSVSIGATEIHFFNHPQAKLSYLEFSGQGLSSVSSEIETTKKAMASIGAEFLRDSDKSQVSTETQQMRSSGDRATLISISDSISRLMTKTLQTMAMWLGENVDDISYKLNTDYSLADMSPQMLTAINQAKQTGIFSDYDVYFKLKQGEMIDDSLTFEEWQERKEVEGVDLIVPTQKPQEDTSVMSSLRAKLGL